VCARGANDTDGPSSQRRQLFCETDEAGPYQSPPEKPRDGFQCRNCRTSVFENDAFCRSCGARLDVCRPVSPATPLRRLLRANSDVAQPATAATENRGSGFDRLGELRILTVMFADLVESTVFATQLDAEDFRDVIVAVQRCVTDVANRFGGTVSS
jgi:hypothetical protein